MVKCIDLEKSERKELDKAKLKNHLDGLIPVEVVKNSNE